MQTDRVELKVCERCGGLWLRPALSGLIYCTPCARQMAQLPPPRSLESRRGRPRKRTSDVPEAISNASCGSSEGSQDHSSDCHPERGRAPACSLQRGKPESKDPYGLAPSLKAEHAPAEAIQ